MIRKDYTKAQLGIYKAASRKSGGGATGGVKKKTNTDNEVNGPPPLHSWKQVVF